MKSAILSAAFIGIFIGAFVPAGNALAGFATAKPLFAFFKT